MPSNYLDFCIFSGLSGFNLIVVFGLSPPQEGSSDVSEAVFNALRLFNDPDSTVGGRNPVFVVPGSGVMGWGKLLDFRRLEKGI